MYGEWETTAEAKSARRTFGQAIWTAEVDPKSRFVNRARHRQPERRVWTVFENGPPSRKVDHSR